MESIGFQIFIFGSIATGLTLISGSIPLLRRWKEDHLHNFVSFSAGVLLATAFLHLLPDALERAQPFHVGLCILASFLFLFILEKFIMVHPCEETHCDYHTVGIAAFVGMLIHTFFDGFALGASLFVENLGWVVLFAIMAHKIPASFSLASILKKAKWSPKKILFFILIFGLVIPFGAVVSTLILKPIGDQAIGLALGLSLGTFIYISTSDFLPEVHRSESTRFKNLFSFLLGIALMTLLAFWHPIKA